MTRLASVSASDCARNPAKVAGAVAPACAAGDAGQGDVVGNAFIGGVDRIRPEPHGGDNRADMCFDKGTPGKSAFAPGHQVEHADNGTDMLGQSECGGNRLGRVAQQRIGGVDVQKPFVRHVTRDTAACEPAHVAKRILQPCEIVQVCQGRWAIEPAVAVERLHCRATCPEMN